VSIGRFYAGVAALLRHPLNNTYLVLKRSEEKDFAAGAWECVTGRVDQGEGFSEAVHREAYEELGTKVRIDFIIGTTHFFRGDPKPENELLGVLFCCSIDNPEAIELSPEHSEYRWITAEEAETLFPGESWIKQVIRRAEAIRMRSPGELLDFYRIKGFEL
jgi:8-oxo-dGTP pyrophosphatase MutT (NUDIX family)